MSLEASCDGLYFPNEPYDNILTLHWNDQSTPLEPNTSVIFKVKCTAPQLFHVVPRYGALLLADTAGAAVQNSSKMNEILFGLRDHHNGVEDNAHGAAPASAMNRASTARTSRAGSVATAGGPAYQERFAIEYVLIKSEPLAFHQIFSTLSDHAKLTEVVKSMWSLVASGAIQRTHLGVQSSINLKVYMENVVRNRNDSASVGGGETAKIVVPAEARLVAVSAAHDRASAAPSTTARRSTEGGAGSTPASSAVAGRRKPADELRALKEEINTMRRDSSSPASSSTPRNSQQRGGAATAAAAAVNGSGIHQGMDPLSPPAGATAVVPAANVNPDDVLMKFGNSSSAASTEKKKGLKVSVVLLLMFALYIVLLLLRRSGAPPAASGLARTAGDASAEALAVQVSSRAVEVIQD